MESVLITGANRGLGYELLKVFSQNGFITFPVVRSEEAFKTIRSTFSNHCHPILADVSNDGARDAINSAIGNEVNSLDVVINNAGISGQGHLIESVSTTEVNGLFNVHCLGPIRVVQACLPHLRNSHKPRIVNVSSRLGSLQRMASGEFKGRYFSYSYRMVKAAQNMFSLSLSQELEDENIVVCAIHPGQLLTRGKSADADMDASVAANNIFEWVQIIGPSDTGSFVQPQIGKHPW